METKNEVTEQPKSEKVKVKSTSVKKQTDTYTILDFETEDGRKAQTFDKLTNGQEVTGVFTKDQYGLKFKQDKEAKSNGKFPAKDYGFEKKRVALECAVEMANKQGLKSSQVLEVAKEFHTFLNS